MMSQTIFNFLDKVFDVIQHMQKCLQCSICLHTISSAVKTPCGHSFCRPCIGRALHNEKASCPLCNGNLDRRSLVKDERMELYCNQLRKLVDAIQADTGVDILSYRKKPRDTKESCSSENSNYSTSELKANVNPERSSVYSLKIGPSKSVTTQPKQTARKSLKTSQSGRHSLGKKNKNSGHLDSLHDDGTRSLMHYGFSEVHRISADSRGPSTDALAQSKVSNWLKSFSETVISSDVNRMTPPLEPTDHNLDDTLIDSVSKAHPVTVDSNESDGHYGPPERLAETDNEGRQTYNSVKRLFADPVLSDENNATDTNKGGKTQLPVQTKNVDPPDRQPGRAYRESLEDQQKPSTSNAMKSVDNSLEDVPTLPDNTDKFDDTDKLTGMRSSTKQNWSTIAKFGKELRRGKKKKKMKTLNVSIETRKKLSLSNDAEEERELIKEGANNGESNISEDRLPNIDSVRLKLETECCEETAPQSRGNASPSEGTQPPLNSSFLTLKEGLEVHIRNLSSDQMNDIIGVEGGVYQRTGDKNEPSCSNKTEKSKLSLKKRNDQFRTPQSDRTGTLSPQVTPVNVFTASEEGSPFRIRNLSQILSPKFRTPTFSHVPSHRRLSLRKSSDGSGRRSSESSGWNDDARVSAIRRDLIEEMDGKRKSVDEERNLSFGVRNGVQKDEGGRDSATLVKVSFTASSSKDSKERGASEQNTCSVEFRKLGKIVKKRKAVCRFLYLRSTRRSQFPISTESLSKLERPSNLVDILSEHHIEPRVPENSFGNNSRITCNETVTASDEATSSRRADAAEKSVIKPTVLQVEMIRDPDRFRSMLKMKTSSKKIDHYKHPSTNTCSVNVPESVDVVFLSMNENEENAGKSPSQKKGRPKASSSKSVDPAKAIANEIKMMSPEKDSQLKFLSESLDVSRTSNLVQQMDPANDGTGITKLANLSQLKGAHSRALLRSSLLNTADSDASSDRKRKRKEVGREDSCSMKRKTEGGDVHSLKGSDSDESFHSRATEIVNCVSQEKKEICKKTDELVNSMSNVSQKQRVSHFGVTIDLSSDSELTDGNADGEEPKKVYRRIVPYISSDTNSTDGHGNRRKNEKDVGNEDNADVRLDVSKRKRELLADSDDDTDVIAIVNSWCNDIPDRFPKRGKLEEANSHSLKTSQGRSDMLALHKTSSNSGNVQFSSSRDASTLNKDPFDSERVITRRRQGRRLSGEDCNSIIDRVLEIKRSKDESAFDGASDIKVENLLQDNFDEIIANVDTQALARNLPVSEETNDDEWIRKSSGSRIKSTVPSHAVAATSFDSNSADKENCVKRRKLQASCARAKDEKTSKAGLNNSQEKTSGWICSAESNLSFEGLRAREIRRRTMESSPRDAVSKLLPASKSDLVKWRQSQPEIDEGEKERPSEPDSHMDITHEEMMLKQFEEDLFGRVEKIPGSMTEFGQTDKRASWKATDESCPKLNTRTKNAECSSEEDDIVESTPNTKTKNAPAINLVTRTPLGASQVTRRVEVSSTSSSPLMRTPSSHREVYPLYQSTPLTTQYRAKKNCGKTSAHMKSQAESSDQQANSSFNKQAKGDATASFRQVPDNRKLRFTNSSLRVDQIERVKELARMCDATYVTQFQREVTHVIVSVDKQNNGANKTLKYLQGIAHRKWIVGFSWVVDSLREKKLLNEELYEAVDGTTLLEGPRQSRLRTKGLFEEFAFLCIGPYADVRIEQYQDLLLSTGATVVDTLEALVKEKKKLKAIVIQPDIHDNRIIGEWYNRTGAVPVIDEWILDCISQYRLISLYPFVQELTAQDVLALGYPQFLVEEEADGDSVSICEAST